MSWKNKEFLSTESSRASFSSSSCSSSFSSRDSNKAFQAETFSFDRTIFPETPSREPVIVPSNASPQFDQQTLDLQEVVKDSIYEEYGLAVKTVIREEAVDSLVKPWNSPKLEQLLKTNDISYSLGSSGKWDFPVDPMKSLRAVAKLDETHQYFKPCQLTRSSSYHSKDGSTFSSSKDTPRFSYDGNEVRHSSFESRDSSNSSLERMELLRVSLDSTEGSIRSFLSDVKSSFVPKTLMNGSSSSSNKVCGLQKAQGIQPRPSSVVAKLMGLETLPGYAPTSDGDIALSRTSPGEDAATFSKSFEITEQPIWMTNSSKSLRKEPHLPHLKNPDSVMKPVLRFPIEPAPQGQFESTQGLQKPASMSTETLAKPPSRFPSVYSEIEKRVKNLEFSQSGQDLKALKQIMEAMQSKGLPGTQKQSHDSNFTMKKEIDNKYGSSIQNVGMAKQQKTQYDQVTTSASREPNSLTKFASPIVIMKPARLVAKPGISCSCSSSSSVISLDSLSSLTKVPGSDLTGRRTDRVHRRTEKDRISKIIQGGHSVVNCDTRSNKNTLKSTETFTRTHRLPKESSTTSIKSTGSISPRSQPEKRELEKQSRLPAPPSDSRSSRRPTNRRQTESSSPGGRRRPKYSNFQECNDQLADISSARDSSVHKNESVQLNGNVMLDSKADAEVTSYERSLDGRSDQTPTRKASVRSASCMTRKKSTLSLSEDESRKEAVKVSPEFPSPVSVLDNALCSDNSPSPMKQILEMFKGDEFRGFDELSSTSEFGLADHVTHTTVGCGLTSGISQKRLQNIEHLIEKLTRLNSSHDEAHTDYIASLCDNPNPDRRYISEVLLASGLLLIDLGSGVTSFQFHSSGHPVNPELFLVLEQTKKSSSIMEIFNSEKASKEKCQRKLIFDAVNEILARKLISLGPSSEPLSRPKKLAWKTFSAQKLLHDMCSEVEQLQTKRSQCSLEEEELEDEDVLKTIFREDVMNQSESWTDPHDDISAIILDVERSIFKGLVDEVLIGESTSPRIRRVRHRQLFGKQ